MFLERGATVNDADDKGFTALHICAYANAVPPCQILLEKVLNLSLNLKPKSLNLKPNFSLNPKPKSLKSESKFVTQSETKTKLVMSMRMKMSKAN